VIKLSEDSLRVLEGIPHVVFQLVSEDAQLVSEDAQLVLEDAQLVLEDAQLVSECCILQHKEHQRRFRVLRNATVNFSRSSVLHF
jgi:hypothetical protein